MHKASNSEYIERVLFSIIIPTYNRAAFLPVTLQSVIRQAYSNWECIIVDDGSTDNSLEMVQSISDKRIKYFYKKHAERSAARNFGINCAQGQYICFLDSDDIYLSNHLSSLYEKIEELNFPVAMFHTELLIHQNKEKKQEKWFRDMGSREVIPFLLIGKSLFINAICVSKRCLNVQKFPEKFSYWEDQHLWIRILINFPFYSVKKVTTEWNVNSESSVITNFTSRTLKNVAHYLSCITDLEKNRIIKRCQFIDRRELKDLKIRKASSFLKQYMIEENFLKGIFLYFICLKYIGVIKTSNFYFKITKRHMRSLNSRKNFLT